MCVHVSVNVCLRVRVSMCVNACGMCVRVNVSMCDHM